MKGTDFITNLIHNCCTYGQQLLTILIYIGIFTICFFVIWKVVQYACKLKNVKNIIKLIIKEEKTDDDVVVLDNLSKNFPIMVQELKDVYDAKKPKQISAVDLFENNLIIPSNVESMLRTCINSLTALGLLGTFIGLIASISKIGGIKETEDAIGALLTSIGPAITTTISGVFSSLICTFGLAWVKSEYQSAALILEKELMLEKPSDTNPDYFYDSFTTFAGKKYEFALSKIVDKFLEQMKESLNKDLEAYKNVIHDAMENLKSGEEEFVKGASGLKDTVDNINKYLHETDNLNKNFEIKLKEFTSALDDFNSNFNESKESTFGVLKNVKEINESNLSINSNLLDYLKKELKQLADGFEVMKDMNHSFRQEIMNTPNQLNGSIDNLCNNIVDLTSKVDSRASNTFEEITNILKELSERIERIERLNVFESVNNTSFVEDVNYSNEIQSGESINNVEDNDGK